MFVYYFFNQEFHKPPLDHLPRLRVHFEPAASGPRLVHSDSSPKFAHPKLRIYAVSPLLFSEIYPIVLLQLVFRLLLAQPSQPSPSAFLRFSLSRFFVRLPFDWRWRRCCAALCCVALRCVALRRVAAIRRSTGLPTSAICREWIARVASTSIANGGKTAEHTHKHTDSERRERK